MLYHAHPCMKCSFDISNFLDGISSLSHPIIFSLFLCIVHWRKPYLSLLFTATLHSVEYIFPFLPSFLLLFFPQLFVKTPQTTILPFCISFLGETVLITASCTMLWTSVHNSSCTLCTRSNPMNLFVTSTV